MKNYPSLEYADLFKLINWLLNENTGLSSKNLLCEFLHVECKHPYAPGDAGDRGRCIRVLRLVPEVHAALDRLALRDPKWAEQRFMILQEKEIFERADRKRRKKSDDGA